MVTFAEGDLLDPADPENADLLDDEDGEPEVEHYPVPAKLEKAMDELEADEDGRSEDKPSASPDAQ